MGKRITWLSVTVPANPNHNPTLTLTLTISEIITRGQ